MDVTSYKALPMKRHHVQPLMGTAFPSIWEQ